MSISCDCCCDAAAVVDAAVVDSTAAPDDFSQTLPWHHSQPHTSSPTPDPWGNSDVYSKSG